MFIGWDIIIFHQSINKDIVWQSLHYGLNDFDLNGLLPFQLSRIVYKQIKVTRKWSERFGEYNKIFYFCAVKVTIESHFKYVL